VHGDDPGQARAEDGPALLPEEFPVAKVYLKAAVKANSKFYFSGKLPFSASSS
jgi:hypothetical protein